MRLPKVSDSRRCSFMISTFAGGIDQEPDEQCARTDSSPEAYNVRTDNGALSRCTGFGAAKKYNAAAGKVLPVPALPVQGDIFIYREKENDTLLLRAAGGEYREKYDADSDGLIFKKTSVLDCSGTTYAVNYQSDSGAELICGGPTQDMMRSTPLKTSVCEGSPKMYRAVIYAERLFGVGNTLLPNRIYFSKQYQPSDFTVSAEAGGYIDVLPDYGSAVDIVTFGNSIYIFWQYGVTRLKAFGYQSDFVLSDCYRCSAEILRGTVQVCTDRIIFAAADGVYSFDGESVRKISRPVKSFFDSRTSKVTSACFRDCYYIAMYSPAYAGENANVLLKYDLHTAKWELYVGPEVRRLFCISRSGQEQLMFLGAGNRLYAFDGSDSYDGSAINSKWVSPMNALGRPDMLKRSRCVIIGAQGSGRLKLTLSSERGSACKHVVLGPERRIYRVPLRVLGQMLSLTVENDGGNDFTAAAPMVVFTAERV